MADRCAWMYLLVPKPTQQEGCLKAQEREPGPAGHAELWLFSMFMFHKLTSGPPSTNGSHALKCHVSCYSQGHCRVREFSALGPCRPHASVRLAEDWPLAVSLGKTSRPHLHPRHTHPDQVPTSTAPPHPPPLCNLLNPTVLVSRATSTPHQPGCSPMLPLDRA